MSMIHFIGENLSSYDNSFSLQLNFSPADCQTEAAASAQQAEQSSQQREGTSVTSPRQPYSNQSDSGKGVVPNINSLPPYQGWLNSLLSLPICLVFVLLCGALKCLTV